MPLYDYRCEHGHTTEALRPVGVALVECRVCGAAAHRAPAHRIAITRPEVDTRGMFRRFVEAGSELEHAAGRVEGQTGQPVETPGLWRQAKARADAIIAAGENPYTP